MIFTQKCREIIARKALNRPLSKHKIYYENPLSFGYARQINGWFRGLIITIPPSETFMLHYLTILRTVRVAWVFWFHRKYGGNIIWRKIWRKYDEVVIIQLQKEQERVDITTRFNSCFERLPCKLLHTIVVNWFQFSLTQHFFSRFFMINNVYSQIFFSNPATVHRSQLDIRFVFLHHHQHHFLLSSAWLTVAILYNSNRVSLSGVVLFYKWPQ